jgi:cell division protease FtsH
MNLRSLAIWGVIGMILIALYSVMNPARGGATSEISYSEVIAKVDGGSIKSATVQGEHVRLRDAENKPYTAIVPPAVQADLVQRMESADVKVQYQSASPNIFVSLIGSLLPILLLIGVWIFFMRQMQGGARGAMGFGKSKAKLLTENKTRVTFDDVAGVEEAKDDLVEIVDFLKDPSKFQKLGGKIPKGALLVGPPGTGKTLLARAVAGEAGVPFFSISGSDFVEMFVGVGRQPRPRHVRTGQEERALHHLHRRDRRRRPSPRRGPGRRQRRAEQTLNQLLVEMDGFESNEGIILIAATNRPDVLDPALLRPGRFDRQVVVPNPDVNGREKILRVHMRNVPWPPTWT